MNSINKWLAVAGIATLCLGVNNLMAQPGGGGGGGGRGGGGMGGGMGGGGRGGMMGGNMDPAQMAEMQAQMMQRQTDRIKEQFGSTDEEWNAIRPLVEKVLTLRNEQLAGGGMGGRGGGGGRGGMGMGANTAPEVTALTTAVEGDASKDDLKAKMAAYRKARDAKQAELKAAQDNLKKVLNTKQEAIALQMSLVN